MTPPPVLVAVAGLPGTGRRRFGRLVAERTKAPLVELEVDPGRADPLPSAAEYGAGLRRAVGLLAAGSPVVFVAPFHSAAARRELMRAAGDARCALLFVACGANEAVRRRRLRERFAPPAIERLLAADPRFDTEHHEIPRACQMVLDTTVGVALWASLAAGRVETFREAGTGESDRRPQALFGG